MKNILIPTDFSACATDALHAGMMLAKHMGARVHVYSRLDIPESWFSMDEAQKAAEKEALQNIHIAEVLFEDIKKQYPDVDIETHYSGGNLIEQIQTLTETKNIDLVVMGSHGAGGKSDYFIGSNTQRVVRLVHRPVLVLKNRLEKLEFKKVVFASDFLESEKKAFLKFKNFIKHFIPEIHLLVVRTASIFEVPYVLHLEALEEYKKLCYPFECKTHIYKDFSVKKGVLTFADEIGADLIAISNHERHPLKRMLAGSNVEALVNHAKVPVLTIDYPPEA
ncbi:MAG: universal stress protein [Bacteroidetes bacterium]|nr:MAG: universal stress protein [Bacteroidota bacterium]